MHGYEVQVLVIRVARQISWGHLMFTHSDVTSERGHWKVPQIPSWSVWGAENGNPLNWHLRVSSSYWGSHCLMMSHGFRSSIQNHQIPIPSSSLHGLPEMKFQEHYLKKKTSLGTSRSMGFCSDFLTLRSTRFVTWHFETWIFTANGLAIEDQCIFCTATIIDSFVCCCKLALEKITICQSGYIWIMAI